MPEPVELAPPGTQYLETSVAGALDRAGWLGPWPPPKHMLLVAGKHASTWAEVPGPERLPMFVEALAKGFTITVLEQVSCSQLPDDVVFAKDARVMRGAAYEPRGPFNPEEPPV